MKKSMFFLALLAASAWPGTAFAGTNMGIEEKVREAFADAQDMIQVAKCESGFRQFGPDGAVLRGGNGRVYLGIFQISEALHAAKASAQGMDIATIEGNIAYAKGLYAASGINPWLDCAPAARLPSAANGTFAVNLRIGMRHPDVRQLQKKLNALGFAIADSGAGSAGNETDLFGALTREAVRRFQCAKGIICDGSETTTGYGRAGPMTRAALNAIE